MQSQSRTRRLILALSLFLGGLAIGSPFAAASAGNHTCVGVGTWALPVAGAARPIAPNALFARLAQERAVLLGEQHDNEDHHRWELQTIAGLYAVHPRLALGFEMFPRRVQPVLDQWVAGKLSPQALLTRTDWNQVWGFDPAFYLPIFEFARMNRVPMLALNVRQSLAHRIAQEGLSAVPPGEREGVGEPAPAGKAYRAKLYRSFLQHPRAKTGKGESPPGPDSPEFRHFVDAMLFWDRAMAQGIAAHARRDPATLVVAVMGEGHVRDGFGVARQLADLGLHATASLLPWDASAPCTDLDPRLATALFGIAPRPEPPPGHGPRAKPRLGIQLATRDDTVHIVHVIADSLAQRAGLRRGDVIESLAGRPVTTAAEVAAAVHRQPAGTWLPMRVSRGGRKVDIVVRFPPRPTP